MPKQKHNPDTSEALVVRYLIADPRKHKVVKRVKGKKAAIELTEKLKNGERQPGKYSYLWRWEDPRAALEYDLEQLDQERS